MRFARLALQVTALVAVPLVIFFVIDGRSGDDGDSGTGTAETVSYEQVQTLFDENCVGCHPAVNASIDLTAGNSYRQLVGVQALEDPNYLRVVVGDPGKSFLYFKVTSFPGGGTIGGRMPFGQPPLSDDQVAIIRDWIAQGARGPDGELPPAGTPTPGNVQIPPPVPDLDDATSPLGNGTITGTVRGQDMLPVEGALVTLLLRNEEEQGGEEHYRVAVTDAQGRYTLSRTPAGRFELKAYAPEAIYTSHLVGLEAGATQVVDFGLADRVLPTPTVSNARVALTQGGPALLSMTVRGSSLDPNYTLAVNPGSGLSVELHRAGNTEGTWSAETEEAGKGPWIFVATDRNCNVSDFITVAAPRSPS